MFKTVATGTNASLGGQYQHTDADTIDNLTRLSGGGGASTGLIKDPLVPSGIEYIGYKRDEEGGYEGTNVNIGPQLSFVPVEVHATVGWTWLLFPEYAEPQNQGFLPLSDYSYQNYLGEDWYFDPVTGEYVLTY